MSDHITGESSILGKPPQSGRETKLDSGIYVDQLKDVWFDKCPAGAAVLTKDLRWERVNAAFCEMVGYTHSELVGMNANLFDLTDPNDAKIEIEEIRKLERGEIREFKFVKTFLHKRKYTVPVDATMFRILNPDGTVRGFMNWIEYPKLDPRFVTVQQQGEDKILRPFVPLATFLRDHWGKISGICVVAFGAIGGGVHQYYSYRTEAIERERDVLRWKIEHMEDALKKKLDNPFRTEE